MSRFIESLKRLYKAGKITAEKVDELLTYGKITHEEHEYIVGA